MYCVVQTGSRMLRLECGTMRSTLSCACAEQRRASAAAAEMRRRMRESPRSRMSRRRLARPKPLALIMLAVISFVAPLAERWATGRVEPFSSYGLAEMALSLVILFWWYHVDKAEHAYRAGKLMNAGVLLLAVVALPVYFIRSR